MPPPCIRLFSGSSCSGAGLVKPRANPPAADGSGRGAPIPELRNQLRCQCKCKAHGNPVPEPQGGARSAIQAVRTSVTAGLSAFYRRKAAKAHLTEFGATTRKFVRVGAQVCCRCFVGPSTIKR